MRRPSISSPAPWARSTIASRSDAQGPRLIERGKVPKCGEADAQHEQDDNRHCAAHEDSASPRAPPARTDIPDATLPDAHGAGCAMTMNRGEVG